jgi:hypothetical protein
MSNKPELELKHIAPYLEHDLRYVAKRESDIFNDTWADESINNQMTFNQALLAKDKKAIELLNSPITVELHLGYEYKDLHLGCGEFALGYPVDDVFAKEVKPLLRPMSDLFKDIVHNERKVNVSILLKRSLESSSVKSGKFLYPLTEPLAMPYFLVQVLFEYHFDVFGLIKKGLAEPIKNK